MIKVLCPLYYTARGRKLELERKKPNNPYGDLDNLMHCCYGCNNAKTDEFTEEEFKEIGKVIGKIWKSRLQRIKHRKT